MNKTAYLYVDERSISPSLICPICLDVLQEPHIHTTCDSAFCRSCLLQLVEPHCPICRWTWDPTIPIEYNIYLPKANRLIRNMLDDLRVQCVCCHTIRRRGQFDHECQPNGQISLGNISTSKLRRKLANIKTILSVLALALFILFVYINRCNIFEQAVDRGGEIVKDIGYNIDYFLLEKVYGLSKKLVEYSMALFVVDICFWISIIFYGDRFISKTNGQILRKFLETSIIINLIIYSFSY